mmetsp:Transcript_2832/g.8824  ORF Transcript_2832/g.8824 Transcript_2832/m.8824 type:complete len:202 (-) Transcript_2832:680-1285(-)
MPAHSRDPQVPPLSHLPHTGRYDGRHFGAPNPLSSAKTFRGLDALALPVLPCERLQSLSPTASSIATGRSREARLNSHAPSALVGLVAVARATLRPGHWDRSDVRGEATACSKSKSGSRSPVRDQMSSGTTPHVQQNARTVRESQKVQSTASDWATCVMLDASATSNPVRSATPASFSTQSISSTVEARTGTSPVPVQRIS